MYSFGDSVFVLSIDARDRVLSIFGGILFWNFFSKIDSKYLSFAININNNYEHLSAINLHTS